MDLQNLQEKRTQVITDKNQSEQVLKKAEMSMQQVRLNIVRLDAQLSMLDDMIQTEESYISKQLENDVVTTEPITYVDEK